MPVLVPSKDDQSAIVRSHHATGGLHYIRAKQKLIRLLEEQKQGIISCAVTVASFDKLRTGDTQCAPPWAWSGLVMSRNIGK